MPPIAAVLTKISFIWYKPDATSRVRVGTGTSAASGGKERGRGRGRGRSAAPGHRTRFGYLLVVLDDLGDDEVQELLGECRVQMRLLRQ